MIATKNHIEKCEPAAAKPIDIALMDDIEFKERRCTGRTYSEDHRAKVEQHGFAPFTGGVQVRADVYLRPGDMVSAQGDGHDCPGTFIGGDHEWCVYIRRSDGRILSEEWKFVDVLREDARDYEKHRPIFFESQSIEDIGRMARNLYDLDIWADEGRIDRGVFAPLEQELARLCKGVYGPVVEQG